MESLLALVHSTSSLSGDALNPLIMRALCLPNLYFFGELLEVPRVAAHVQARRCRETCLLGLFCSGTLADYRAQPAMYGELEAPLMEKLKLLTLASLTASEKRVPYARLREALELASDAEVESLVIQAVYAGLVEVRAASPHLLHTRTHAHTHTPSPLSPLTLHTLSPHPPSARAIAGPAGPAGEVRARQGLCRAGRAAQ